MYKGTKELKQKKLQVNGSKKITHMMHNDTRKQAKPIEKWSENVDQNFCWSKNNLSEIRVRTPDNNKNIHPDGRQLLKENEGFCREEKISII